MTTAPPRIEDDARATDNPGKEGGAFSPLPGEMGLPDVAAAQRQPVSKKGVLAVVLFVCGFLFVSTLAIQRLISDANPSPANDGKAGRDKPAAATSEPRRLDLSAAAASVGPSSVQPVLRVPALVPTEEELPEPIGVRRTGSAAGSAERSPARSSALSAPGTQLISPEDAPVLLVSGRHSAKPHPGPITGIVPPGAETHEAADASTPEATSRHPLDATSRNLQGYQRQLQGLLESLTRTSNLARGGGTVPTPAGMTAPSTYGAPSPGGLFGGQLLGSTTPKAVAAMLGNRSLTLPKGSAFTCALKSRVVTASSGMVGCMVQRNVYSDDGRVLLIERGSHLDGEYRITTARPGMVRIPVLWTRLRTPLGVTVDIDSPATGPLGESGIDGHVDNRWAERLGAAMLVSLIDDSVKLVVQQQSNDRQDDTIVLPSTTSNSSKLAEKVLDSTINIPPLIYRNQGGIVGIYVARDVDFSNVYALVPTTEGPDRP